MSEPYLLNRWYQAAFSEEVTETPLARTFLDIPVILYRSGEAIAALEDRCPHRFAPLSMGSVRDGAVVCGYHGLAFGPDGACTHNPHGRISPAMRVRTFPAAERHTVVWIWMGDARKADPAPISASSTGRPRRPVSASTSRRGPTTVSSPTI